MRVCVSNPSVWASGLYIVNFEEFNEFEFRFLPFPRLVGLPTLKNSVNPTIYT